MKKILSLILAVALLVCMLCGCESKPVFTIYNWEDYIDPGVLDDFKALHPEVEVVYENFTTNEDMYTKLKNGGGSYDVIIPSDYIIEKLISENLLAEINFENVPNYEKIAEHAKNLDFDPDNKYTVPYMWGTLGIIYDKQAVSEDEITWDVLFGDKYKTIMMKSIRDAMGAALAANGYSVNSENKDEIEVAKKFLIAQKEQENFYGYGFDDIKDKMVRGEADAALIYAGDAMYSISQNDNLAYAVPKEGSNIWFDAMVIPASSENKELAEEFINFMCETENARRNAEYIGYYTSQAEAADEISEESGNPYPAPESLVNCEIYKMFDDEVMEIYNKAWTEIFA